MTKVPRYLLKTFGLEISMLYSSGLQFLSSLLLLLFFFR